MNSNSATWTGGVAPSTWTDGNGVASQMSSDFDVLRTLFTKTGPIIDAQANTFTNMLVFANVEHAHSSTNGRVVSCIFRVRNSNAGSTSWTFSYTATSYGGWSESTSVSLNQANQYSSTANGFASHSVTMSLRSGSYGSLK